MATDGASDDLHAQACEHQAIVAIEARAFDCTSIAPPLHLRCALIRPQSPLMTLDEFSCLRQARAFERPSVRRLPGLLGWATALATGPLLELVVARFEFEVRASDGFRRLPMASAGFRRLPMASAGFRTASDGF